MNKIKFRSLLMAWIGLTAGGAVFNGAALGADWRISGQLSGWAAATGIGETRENNAGLRYIPQVSVNHAVSEDAFLDAEMALNGFTSLSSRDASEDADLKLYRLIFRFAGRQMESRAGLQKISFGPAYLLRSLQWFDRLDPRDPLDLTDGVYGLQFKYTCLSNANYWFWGLLGNDDLKGLEFLPTDDSIPEFGGRIQYPVPFGEVAATVHTRKMDLSKFRHSDERETRFALDGRWDRVVGFWFEAVCQRQEIDFLPFKWAKFTTIGMDYTFSIGNGLHVLGEHLVTAMSRDLPEWRNTTNVSAFLIHYPSGIFDSLSLIGYYNWNEKVFSPYLGWTRTLDDLDVTLSFFDYPKTAAGSAFALKSETMVPGSGIRLVLVYHH